MKYHGHEYQATSYGSWGVRIERGYGREHSILIVPDLAPAASGRLLSIFAALRASGF